ncbi:hypothetical protein ACC741_37870, partial [Rhizobium johnstonii]|uniref:hypothetical protein n=1 Tax=Rhizobium johnstonii TaxID=3019933 RepID=UPI003F9C2ADB
AKKGDNQPPRNWQRCSNPELDKIIESIRGISAEDPKGVELGKDYLKLVAREMPTIPLMPRMLSMILSSSGLLQRCQLRGG